MKKTLPPVVTKLCYGSSAWIVGSGADPSIENPRDWDVAVSFSEWRSAALLIPARAKPNRFGGWVFSTPSDQDKYSKTVVVNVWPFDMAVFLTYNPVHWVWHPETGARFMRDGKP